MVKRHENLEALAAEIATQATDRATHAGAAANANAAFPRRMDPTEWEALVRQARAHRAAAAETARALLAENAELRELAAAQPSAVQGSLELLAFLLPDRDTMLRWLNAGVPDLGMKTPLQVMRDGRAELVEGLLYDALTGAPT